MERAIHQIRLDIEAIAGDKALYKEANFNSREVAIDFVEFNLIGQIEGLLLTPDQAHQIAELRQAAEIVKNRLEEVNENLFQKLRANIRSGDCTGARLKRQIVEYVGPDSTARPQDDDIGYDSVDAFINGLLLIGAAPGETKEREPDMVPYQPTPARVILELVEQADLRQGGVFYDVGSGLGQVAMLVNLLGGIRAKGVEFEPAYCDYARRCARELNLPHVEFINVDAREADYSDGTVFYMYTPFKGRLLEEVLEKLKGEVRKRPIWVYTYGPCTRQVSQQSWLVRVDRNGDHVYKLAMFRSA